MPGSVNTLTSEAALSHYVTSNTGQLSLAIPLWVDAMSTIRA